MPPARNTRKPHRVDLRDPVGLPTSMAPAGFTSQGTLDLIAGSELPVEWSVADNTRLSVQANLASGNWTSARVEIRGGIDRVNWEVIKTLTGPGFSPALDVAPYSFVDIVVVADEAGDGGKAAFLGYAYSPAFA